MSQLRVFLGFTNAPDHTLEETTGTWQSAGLFTNSRAISVSGLTPDGNYQFQFRAVGGATGYSDWSDPVSHMSL